MRILREWVHRLWATIVPGRRDEDLQEELRLHLELVADEARRRGHDPDEAVRVARLEAGGPAQAMEALRDQRGLLWLEDLGRDVRYGLRVLRRSPAFAAVAVLTLALGIGATGAIFNLIDAVSLRSLPVGDPQRLVDVRADGTDGFGINVGSNGRVTYPLWEQIRTHQRAFSGIFAWANGAIVLGRGADAQFAENLWVSGDFFRVLGVRPALGRLLDVGDDRPGCDADVAVVSHDFWQTALGGREAAGGNTLTIFDRPFTVVGVAPEGFGGLEVGRTFDVALPLCVATLADRSLERRDVWALRVMGRLGPGWTLAAADEHLRALSPGLLDATLPEGYSAELIERYREFRFGAFPAARGVSRLRERHSMSLALLLGLTGLVLLITCANLATLMIARAGAREREIAMRAAMGASRRRLVSQMVVESLLLAAAGAAAAVPVALVSARTLVTFLQTPDDPIRLTLRADWRIVAFAATAGMVTALLFGLLPALRVSMVDPMAATRETSRGLTVDRHRVRFRRGLVACQIALSLILVVSALLFVRTFRNLSSVELGFDPDRLVAASFFHPAGAGVPPERRLAFQEELTTAIRAVPGVATAAASTHVPLSGATFAHFFRLSDDAETKLAWFSYVSPGYFETLGVPIVSGRDIDSRDHAASPRVVLVNESFVRAHLGTRPPIGATVRTRAEAGYPETTYEIVGVVGDTKYARLRDEDCLCDAGTTAKPPQAYVPLAQHPSLPPWAPVIARIDGPLPQVRNAIAERVEALDPAIRVRFTELAARIDGSLASERALAWLAGALAALAILLVVVGLYGVIAYFVVSRRTEIGIRQSLGSTRAQIVGLVLRDSYWLLALGALIGLPLAVAASRGAETLLFGVSAADVPTLAGATMVLAMAGSLAGAIPAWRAALLPPMAAIRDEPESMWRTTRVTIQRAVRELTAGAAPSALTDAVLGDVAGAIQGAASSPDAVQAALATLRERVGAQRILLLQRTANGDYACAEMAIPAGGALINRLRHYPHPLPLASSDFRAWRQWALEFRPGRLAEIETLERAGIRLAVALRTSNEVAAVLLLGQPDGRDDFTAEAKQLLRRAASVFALLVENGRLNARAIEQEKVRRDLSLAAEVQKRLLPTELPPADVAEFSAVSLPARSIGGDYFDFIEAGDGRIGIALADVSGKGIAAALIMSVVQASLRIIASDGAISLPQLAARLNDYVYRTTPGNKYATFFYAQVDGGRRQLRYVNAGHNPPFLVRRSGPSAGGEETLEVRELTAGGAVVGMLPGLSYEEEVVDLRAGDVLVAFTDGVTEARSPDEAEFGEERLKTLLQETAHLPAAGIAARLSAAMREWIRDAEQFDDLTFVVMKVR